MGSGSVSEPGSQFRPRGVTRAVAVGSTVHAVVGVERHRERVPGGGEVRQRGVGGEGGGGSDSDGKKGGGGEEQVGPGEDGAGDPGDDRGASLPAQALRHRRERQLVLPPH